MSLNDCYKHMHTTALLLAGVTPGKTVRLITKAAWSLIKFSCLTDYIVKV